MLIDEVVITVQAGRGGNGAVSLRREKFIPKGGPDGGDGGDGGSVLVAANPSVHGLARFKGQKDFRAENGQPGGKQRRHGKAGQDLVLTVPPGTKIIQIINGQEQLVSDLVQEGQRLKIAEGGKGGKGNWHFRSATHQTPLEFEEGQPGQTLTLKLELQLIADVGLIGLPNAGKSTFLSVVSRARPKIADYAFTTLEPNLGMIRHHGAQFVIADLPGLIEGAAKGRGLGIKFLKHVMRTKVLIHLIAVAEIDPEKVYTAIRDELKQFDPGLLKKPEVVVISKIDIDSDWQKTHETFIKKHRAIGMSAVTHQGIDAVLNQAAAVLD